MMSRLKRLHNDEGNLIIVLLIMMVATALVFALIVSVESGLRSSRRSGNSANALQVADAGVNEAVKIVPTLSFGQSPYTSTGKLAGNNFSWSAVLDPGQLPTWHVDSVGTDPSGVQRHIRADAVPETLFRNALFIRTQLTMSSGGSVDSFIDGSSQSRMCSRHGIIGSNDGANISFGNNGKGVGVRNCTQNAYGPPWPYPVDGCISYADSNPVLPSTGSGQCPPPPDTHGATPSLPTPTISPAGTFVDQPNACDSTHPIVSNGQPILWNSVTLLSGCFIDATKGPVVIYTTGKVSIGDPKGASGLVNPPPSVSGSSALPTSACPAGSITPGLLDQNNNPSSFYCRGWAGQLRIYSSSSATSITLQNHVQFWGMLITTNGGYAVGGSGTPHVEMWGGIISNTAAPAAQLSLHYDEDLGSITTGRYFLQNWRECPLNNNSC